MPAALNLARFDLVSIRLVVLAAHGGSLTAAAAQSHLALAAASRRLRELEAALGTPLFERHARGLRATAAGEAVVKQGLAMLQAMDSLAEELANLRDGVAQHVRLAAGTAAVSQFLPPLLARYATLQPALRVDLQEQVSEVVVQQLREARVDLGIFVDGAVAPAALAGLPTRLFRQDELVLLLPQRHPLARGRGALAFADLLGEPWIGLNTGAAVLRAQQQAALAAGRPLRLRMQVRSFDATCHMVASGLGLALLPRAASAPLVQALGLRMRTLAEPWARRRLLLATALDPAPAPVAQLADFLCQPEPSQNAKAGRRQRQ